MCVCVLWCACVHPFIYILYVYRCFVVLKNNLQISNLFLIRYRLIYKWTIGAGNVIYNHRTWSRIGLTGTYPAIPFLHHIYIYIYMSIDIWIVRGRPLFAECTHISFSFTSAIFFNSSLFLHIYWCTYKYYIVSLSRLFFSYIGIIFVHSYRPYKKRIL